jgi:hypothetical protein
VAIASIERLFADDRVRVLAGFGLSYGRVRDYTGTSYGGALRVAWNLATIVTIDYGVSSEDAGFYINFNHIF